MEAKEIIIRSRIIINIIYHHTVQTEAFGYCGSSASRMSCVCDDEEKENQILCVQNVLILELFIDIKIFCEMPHVC